MRKYYGAAGKTIAVREDADPPSYLLHDHLGGTTGVTDGNGTLVEETRYWPYGGVRAGAVARTDRLFTGQRQEVGDAQMGLYNYKARFYSAGLGRFASPDPSAKYSTVLMMDAGRLGGTSSPGDGANSEHKPLDLQRYTYAGNSPARYADADGLCFTEPWSGELMPCSARIAYQWLACAGGWCSWDLARYAANIVRTDEFLFNVMLYLQELYNDHLTFPEFYPRDENTGYFRPHPIVDAFNEGWAWAGVEEFAREHQPRSHADFGCDLLICDGIKWLVGTTEGRCAGEVMQAAAPWIAAGGGAALVYTGVGAEVGIVLMSAGIQGIQQQALAPERHYALPHCGRVLAGEP